MTTASSPQPLALSLGSNLGDRLHNLRRAVWLIGGVIDLVRISDVFETDPLDATEGSGAFLNLVLVGHSRWEATDLLVQFRRIEKMMGRQPAARNAPRSIDIDMISYGAHLVRSATLELPHPRFREREFVLAPLRQISDQWIDALTGEEMQSMRGRGEVRSLGALY